jgi:FtsP/CotA-like multicopper oxidase with cupredoxin domain
MTRSLPRFAATCVLLLAVAPGAPWADTLPATTCPQTAPGARVCDLFAKAGTVTLPGAGPVAIWGYSATAAGPATSPGPVLVVNQGDRVTLRLTNQLPARTSVGVSGQTVPPDVAGVGAGATKDFVFVASEPGTFLYQAGLVPGTQYQVPMGLHGALVVRPAGTPLQAYGDPATAFDDEAVVVLGELDPALNGAADPATFDLRAFAPRYWLLNGHPYPDTAEIPTLAGHRVLLRYANAGLEAHAMSLLGVAQASLAVDGGRTPRPFSVVSQELAAGQTADALVTVPPGAQPGTRYPLYEGALALHNASEPGFGGMLTFLVAGTGAPGPRIGPITTGVAVAPSPTTGAAGVTVTATVSGAPSTVVAAELFLDAAGTDGTGLAMAASDGAFGGASEVVTATLSSTALAGLVAGGHAVYVHGRDAAGAWGSVSSAVLLLDAAGPSVLAAAAPNPTNGTVSVEISATGDDRASGGSAVVAAELFVDPIGTPPFGTGAAMTAGPVSDVTSFTATLPPGLASGDHAVAVRAQDALGTWGPLATTTLHVDRSGPAVSGVAAVPAATNGTQSFAPGNPSIRVTATVSDAGAGGSRVAAAEGFVDTAGASGTGFQLLPADGLFDEPEEAVFADVPLATVVQLPQGSHAFVIRGRDGAGNWGATASTPFVFDTVRPSVGGVAAAPNPTGGAPSVALTATATDPVPSSGIGAAEWFDGADPGPGFGNPMQPGDGAFGGATEGLTATIDVAARGWLPGPRTLSVRARDRAGTWSAVATVTLTVERPNAIFSDGFESGSFSAWNGGATGPGLAVTTAARLGTTGSFGMAVTVGTTVGRFVTDTTPSAEPTYHARFWLDPNDTGTGGGTTGNVWDVFTGLNGAGTTLFRVQYRRNGGVAGTYQVRGQVTTSTGGTVSTPFVTITNAPHAIEIAWSATNATGATRLQLFVDGATPVAPIATGNTSTFRLETVRLGRSAGTNGGATGTLYFDQFASTRRTVIGP